MYTHLCTLLCGDCTCKQVHNRETRQKQIESYFLTCFLCPCFFFMASSNLYLADGVKSDFNSHGRSDELYVLSSTSEVNLIITYKVVSLCLYFLFKVKKLLDFILLGEKLKITLYLRVSHFKRFISGYFLFFLCVSGTHVRRLKSPSFPHVSLHALRIRRRHYGNHSALMHFSGPAWLTVAAQGVRKSVL